MELFFAYLLHGTDDVEAGGFSVGISRGYFCFAGAAVADGYWEGGTVRIAGVALFNDINLNRVEGEDLQRKEDMMAAGNRFSLYV